MYLRSRNNFWGYKYFKSEIKEWSDEILSNCEHHKGLVDIYGFGISLGGRGGGDNSSLIEIYYGQRPVYKKKERVKDTTGRYPFGILRTRLVPEAGANLRYEQLDNGSVICTLTPARTQNLGRVEDFIILDHILNALQLTGKPRIKKHLKYFYSYMAVSAIDGDPHWIDYIRVHWLLWTRKLVINDKIQERKISKSLGKILSWTLTVGLSGGLLAFVQYFMK